MVNINKDKKWGLKKEEEAIRAFSENAPSGKWNKFEKTNAYNHFDYCAHSMDRKKSAFVEIKSRRNTHDAYDETMVPAIKIQKALELIRLGHKVYFVFNFTDGIYFVKLETASVRFGFSARTDRGAVELGHYAFIGVNSLIQIGEKNE